MDVLHLRLPDAVPAAVGPERGRCVRDREGGRPHGECGPHRPGLGVRAGDRGRSRVAPRAGRGDERAAAGSRAVARAGGASFRPRRRPRAVARPPLRRPRVRLVVPGARRAADRRRVVRSARAREGPDADAGGRRVGGCRALPGQLDPAPAAAGCGRRGVLRGRLGRPLPADDRRGDPHGAVLRRRLRAGAGRRSRRAPGRGRGVEALRGVLVGPPAAVRVHVRGAAVRAAAARGADELAGAAVRPPRRVPLGVPALPRHRAALGGAAGAARCCVARLPRPPEARCARRVRPTSAFREAGSAGAAGRAVASAVVGISNGICPDLLSLDDSRAGQFPANAAESVPAHVQPPGPSAGDGGRARNAPLAL